MLELSLLVKAVYGLDQRCRIRTRIVETLLEKPMDLRRLKERKWGWSHYGDTA